MDGNRQTSRTFTSGVAVAGLFLFVVAGGCKDELPLQGPPQVPGMAAGERVYFFDDFQNGVPLWEPMAGNWDLSQQGSATEYVPVRGGYSLSYAGSPNWSNYRVNAKVVIDDDRQGQVGIVGRGDGSHYYYELLLGRNPQGQKSWTIRQRISHQWVTLATGPFEYTLGTPYVLQLSFDGLKMEGAISRDGGGSFDKLGVAEAAQGSWQIGRASCRERVCLVV